MRRFVFAVAVAVLVGLWGTASTSLVSADDLKMPVCNLDNSSSVFGHIVLVNDDKVENYVANHPGVYVDTWDIDICPAQQH